MADDAKPRGAGGWRKACAGFWTASFVLVLALGLAILPARVGALGKLHQASKIPMPALVETAVEAAGWIPANLGLLGLAWGALMAAAAFAPSALLKPLTLLGLLTALSIAVLGGVALHLTDPSRAPLKPPSIPLGRLRSPPYNYAISPSPGGPGTPGSAVETSGRGRLESHGGGGYIHG